MADRIAGACLLAFALGYGLLAGEYRAGFADPLGPVAFPRLVAVPLGVLALYLLLRPAPDAPWPKGWVWVRQIIALGTLLALVVLLETVGFVPAVAAAVTVLARLLGESWPRAFAYGLGLGVGLWGLFEYGLGLPLPGGVWRP
ncbi:MAG: tripartite tricarboxylate transporter TctB family protein [Candidatus Competibacterales bacterium]